MRRIILAIFIGSLLLVSASPALAACTGETCGGSYPHCEKQSTGADNVGPFLCDISAKCYNTGDCSLADIMTVVNNVGLFILGLIGSLVLLFYVIGGFYFLTARGNSDQLSKGKTILIRATIGMVIVFAAFAGMQAVESALRSGTVTGESSSCTGKQDGASCGLNMVCQTNICMSKCEIEKAKEGYSCQNTSNFSKQQKDQCLTKMCPGDNNMLCCPSN